jgi:hypothetical protein
MAVLFADARGEGKVELGGAVDGVVVVGLQPGRRYELSLDAGSCSVGLAAARAATDPSAHAGGFLRAAGVACGK